MDLGERINPASASDLRKTLVEPLSEVRTKLADFFSILLKKRAGLLRAGPFMDTAAREVGARIRIGSY